MKKIALTLLAIPVICGASPALAEELNDIFKRVNEFVQQKNFPKAMDELSWAQKEISKMHQTRLGELLPAEVNGFKGAEPEFQSVLGFTNIERQYSQGEKQIRLQISGGSGGDGLGGLAGLAKMGMMYGGVQPGTDQFRIEGRTATLKTDGSPEITVLLESGSILQLNADEGVDGPTLKKFAEALKIGALDNYLKGAQG